MKILLIQIFRRKAITYKRQANFELESALEGTLQYDCAKLKVELAGCYMALAEILPFSDREDNERK